MTRSSLRKLDQRGFHIHLILPIIAILVVGGIGAYVLAKSHAATPASYYSSSCTKTTYGAPNSKFQPCALYAQELLNGVQHQRRANILKLTAYGGSTFKYGNIYYLLMNGLYGKYTALAVTAVTGNKNGQLTAGTTGSWQALCTEAKKVGLASGGPAGSATLKFSTAKDETATQTNAGVFTNACGSLVSTKTSSGSGSSSTGSTGTSGSSSTGSSSGASTTSGTPYASALSAYKTLSRTVTAKQMTTPDTNGKTWAQYANDTEEGGGQCPVGNAAYDATNDAVKLSTKGTTASAGSNSDCGHIRSDKLISTNGTVVESKIYLPGSGSTLIDWASYWTDGTNWPSTGELDAIETQYGQSYVTYHYGSNNSSVGTADWDTGSNHINGTAANDAVPGWNVVDMEFQANYAKANVYINGKLYTTVPGSVLAHNSQYINWGISGPNKDDPNNASWPKGAGYEEVQYLKVFTK